MFYRNFDEKSLMLNLVENNEARKLFLLDEGVISS
jgi:hypothetical protein